MMAGFLLDMLDRHPLLVALPILVVCVAFKVYVLHNCVSHPLYRESELFTRKPRKGAEAPHP